MSSPFRPCQGTGTAPARQLPQRLVHDRTATILALSGSAPARWAASPKAGPCPSACRGPRTFVEASPIAGSGVPLHWCRNLLDMGWTRCAQPPKVLSLEFRDGNISVLCHVGNRPEAGRLSGILTRADMRFRGFELALELHPPEPRAYLKENSTLCLATMCNLMSDGWRGESDSRS